MTDRRQPERATPFHRGLTREGITDAALALVDTKGLRGLTMRALAANLEVDVASLYRHVRNKDDLLTLLADALIERLGTVPSPDESDWRGAVAALMHRLRELLRHHPGLIDVVTSGPPTPSTIEITGSALRSLRGAQGADEHDALSLLLAYVIGSVALEPDRSAPARSMSESSGDHDMLLAAAFWEPELEELDERFQRGLDLLLDAFGRA